MAKSAGVEVEDFIEFFRDPPEEAQLKTLAWNDGELDGEGFVDWTPFEHPQLGRVEMGGLKTKFTAQNPPPTFLRAGRPRLPPGRPPRRAPPPRSWGRGPGSPSTSV
jgi:murein tripeptide amidase MpaA